MNKFLYWFCETFGERYSENVWIGMENYETRRGWKLFNRWIFWLDEDPAVKLIPKHINCRCLVEEIEDD